MEAESPTPTVSSARACKPRTSKRRGIDAALDISNFFGGPS
jgi:hypothetical protein